VAALLGQLATQIILTKIRLYDFFDIQLDKGFAFLGQASRKLARETEAFLTQSVQLEI
jgi:hypothetical protein